MSIEQIGKKFRGFLITNNKKLIKRYYAVFKCSECEKNIITAINHSNTTKSCGCLRSINHNKRILKHGLSRTSEYNSWKSMIDRCCKDGREDFNMYKGRNITICKEWYDFNNFIKDMGERPYNTTLDRIDNDLGYYKENCKWSTNKEQSRNRRSNVFLTIDGITKSIIEWSEHENVTTSYMTICKRLKNGWSHKEAVFKPTRPINRKKRKSN
jgi:hypothetical protein